MLASVSVWCNLMQHKRNGSHGVSQNCNIKSFHYFLIVSHGLPGILMSKCPVTGMSELINFHVELDGKKHNYGVSSIEHTLEGNGRVLTKGNECAARDIEASILPFILHSCYLLNKYVIIYEGSLLVF